MFQERATFVVLFLIAVSSVVEATLPPIPLPTPKPTPDPTHLPTVDPSPLPTPKPTFDPTHLPTTIPTPLPTLKPTPEPSALPTPEPTSEPTRLPTKGPSHNPTAEPTLPPTKVPSPVPTYFPTSQPTHTPTHSSCFQLSAICAPSLTSDVAPYTLWAVELVSICDLNLTDYGLASSQGAGTNGGPEYSFEGAETTKNLVSNPPYTHPRPSVIL